MWRVLRFLGGFGLVFNSLFHFTGELFHFMLKKHSDYHAESVENQDDDEKGFKQAHGTLLICGEITIFLFAKFVFYEECRGRKLREIPYRSRKAGSRRRGC